MDYLLQFLLSKDGEDIPGDRKWDRYTEKSVFITTRFFNKHNLYKNKTILFFVVEN